MKHIIKFILWLATPILKWLSPIGMSHLNIDLPEGFYEDLVSRLRPCDVLLTNTPVEATNVINVGKWNHATLYIGKVDGIPMIREAVGVGVVERSLFDFLKSKNELSLKRNTHLDRWDKYRVLHRSEEMLGWGYNWAFEWGSTSIVYCSQYIYRSMIRQMYLMGKQLKTSSTMGMTFYKPNDIDKDPAFTTILETRY